MPNNIWATLIPLIIFFVAMYLFLILPQKKRDKQFREMIAALKVGDDIVTIGGIIGKISSIKDDTITLEVGSDKTKIKMERNSVKTVIQKEEKEA